MSGVRSPVVWYAAFSGVFLLLQGASTLLARLVPAIDRAVPQLLAVTQMVPAHSVLHLATALLAIVAIRRGARATWWFALLFGLFYVGLGAVGIVTGRQLCLGLQPFDHPFHVLLGGLGLAAVAVQSAIVTARRRVPRAGGG